MDTRIIIGAAGLVIGAGLGALTTWRLLKSHYEEITQGEIDSVKMHYAKLFKVGEHSDLAGMVAKYKDRVDDLGYSDGSANDSDEDESDDEDASEEDEDESDDEEQESKEVHNIWKYAEDHPNPEDEPYVITFEQFNDEHDDYEKGDLTYYEGDDILVDSQETPIDDEEALVGSDALTRFGDGSNSNDIVYVRNDKISMDFEISRDPRAYTEHIIRINEKKNHRSQKMRKEE